MRLLQWVCAKNRNETPWIHQAFPVRIFLTKLRFGADCGPNHGFNFWRICADAAACFMQFVPGLVFFSQHSWLI
jgi:hypothetical protein